MLNRPTRPAAFGVAHDVDRAAVAQQVVEFRPIREFVDPLQINLQEPAGVFAGGVETIEVDRLAAVVSAHAYEVTLVTHYIDKLELLEQRGEGIEAFADLRPCLDGDTQRAARCRT